MRWLGAPSLPGEDTVADGVAGCAVDPCEMGWEPNDIGVVANSAFLDANPAAASILESVRIEVDDVLEQNLVMERGENSVEDIAPPRRRLDHRESRPGGRLARSRTRRGLIPIQPGTRLARAGAPDLPGVARWARRPPHRWIPAQWTVRPPATSSDSPVT